MKALALVGFTIIVLVFAQPAGAEDEVLIGWPVPVDRPLAPSKLNGFVETGYKSNLIHFNVGAVSAVFYDREKKVTIVSFDGAIFYNRLRTNLLVSDDIMKFDEIKNLLNTRMRVGNRENRDDGS